MRLRQALCPRCAHLHVIRSGSSFDSFRFIIWFGSVNNLIRCGLPSDSLRFITWFGSIVHLIRFGSSHRFQRCVTSGNLKKAKRNVAVWQRFVSLWETCEVKIPEFCSGGLGHAPSSGTLSALSPPAFDSLRFIFLFGSVYNLIRTGWSFDSIRLVIWFGSVYHLNRLGLSRRVPRCVTSGNLKRQSVILPSGIVSLRFEKPAKYRF